MEKGALWTSDRVADGNGPGRPRRPRLLVLCDYRPHEAATVIDHIQALRRWSRYDVFVLPMFGDLPDDLDLDAFDGLVIHYNVVMSNSAYLSPLARWRVSRFRGVKAAFIQDEYRFVDLTVSVLRTLGVQVLFTCLPQDQVHLVYPVSALPDLKRTVTVLTGYVPDQLLALPVRPYDERTTDVSYRARRLPAWLGSLAQEKSAIADRFVADAAEYGLAVDISCREEDRLYGDAWIDLIGRSKAMLGVESGASVFDFDGSIEREVREYSAAHPDALFQELHRLFLAPVDGRIRLNQISPRCFEAAALGTLMVLYPGEYSGVLQPWRHYVPLEKDHSNMAEVVQAIRDPDTWERISTQARREVALDSRYSFRAMVQAVDDGLDLTISDRDPIDPGAFERLASGNLARMMTGSPHAGVTRTPVRRVRRVAGRIARGLTPSPVAITATEDLSRQKARSVRLAARYARSLAYWAARPHVLPTTLLVAHRSRLLAELSDLGLVQRYGARARAAGSESPFVLVVDERTREVRITSRTDAATFGTPLPDVPRDFSGASGVHIDPTDPWLVPMGVGGSRARQLPALSAILHARPRVGQRLLAGRTPWCDFVVLQDPARGLPEAAAGARPRPADSTPAPGDPPPS